MLVMVLQNFAVISLPLTSSQPINALLVSEGGIKLTLREWLRCHAHVQSKEWYDQILTEVFRFVPSCQFTITMKAVVLSTKAVVYMCLFYFGGSRVLIFGVQGYRMGASRPPGLLSNIRDMLTVLN